MVHILFFFFIRITQYNANAHNTHAHSPLRTHVCVNVLPPATRHGVPGTVICTEGYRRLQELDGKHRETTIYTGLARQKVTVPYV